MVDELGLIDATYEVTVVRYKKRRDQGSRRTIFYSGHGLGKNTASNDVPGWR
jgi:hypothetical protein